MMSPHALIEYASYIGDDEQQGSQYRLHNTAQPIVYYKQKMAHKLTYATKVVLMLAYVSRDSSDLYVLSVHDMSSVVFSMGTIDSINADFGYINSDLPCHSKAFFFARNLRHERNKCGVNLCSLLSVGARVRFEAIPQEIYTQAKYRAVRVVLLEEAPPTVSAYSTPAVVKWQQGIIVKVIHDQSLYVWCKSLGRVFVSKTRRRTPKEQYTPGKWISFDASQQTPVDFCNWTASNLSIIDDQLQYEVVPVPNRRHIKELRLLNCEGIVTNVVGNKAMLWCPQLGHVRMSKWTDGWDNATLFQWSHVIFNAEQILKPEYEKIGWNATSIQIHQEGVNLADYQFERCTAELVEIGKFPTSCCGVLRNHKWGLISFTWLEYHTPLANAVEFENEVKQHREYDVYFVSSFNHSKTEWTAVCVSPAGSHHLTESDSFPKEQVSNTDTSSQVDFGFVNGELVEETEIQQDSYCEMLSKDLEDWSPFQDPIEKATPISFAENACQTEPMVELSLFGMIRDTPALLTLMKQRHRDKLLLLTQLLSNRFTPNHDTAQIHEETSQIYGYRDVACQTAERPESQLARQLVQDEQMFNLLIDINPTVLLSIT